MAKAASTKSYVVIDWDKTAKRKAANAEYEKVRLALRAADIKRRQVIADEMIADKLIPKGKHPVVSVRPWDGVAQLVKDEGVWLFEEPRSASATSSKTSETY